MFAHSVSEKGQIFKQLTKLNNKEITTATKQKEKEISLKEEEKGNNEKILFQKRYTDGQQVHENMFIVTDYQTKQVKVTKKCSHRPATMIYHKV